MTGSSPVANIFETLFELSRSALELHFRIDRIRPRCYFLATPMTPNVLEFRAFSGSSCSRIAESDRNSSAENDWNR